MYTSKHALRAHYKSARAEYVMEHGKANFHDPVASLVHAIGLKRGVLGLYMPIGYEADLTPFLTDPAFSNFTFALPKISECEDMHFVTYYPGSDELKESSFGFKEPVGGDIVVPNLILAPLLAFDEQGNRLGYGKGHYDNYIERERHEGPHHFTYVGIAYPVQKSFDTLPTHGSDQKLDAVVLPSAYILF